jgi:hypothetical protein
MSNTLYNAKQYVKFSADEFLSMLTTSVFVAVILSMHDLFFNADVTVLESVQAALLVFVLILFILLVTVWLCKVVAIRLGYTLRYKEHLIGLFLGFIISFASRGFLPIFLPGGFSFEQPERLRVGKFHGLRKGWELGLVAGTFPLVMLAWVLLFNPLYLMTQSEFYLNAILIVCLFALYACIPLPFIERMGGGRLLDLFKYMRGATFGLDVYYASGAWFIVLCVAVLVFTGLTLLLTSLSVSVGVVIYIVSLVLGLIGLWVYRQFFKH